MFFQLFPASAFSGRKHYNIRRPTPYRLGSWYWNTEHILVTPGWKERVPEITTSKKCKTELKQSTSSLFFKYNSAIEVTPIWGMWWEATHSPLMLFMSPEALAQLHLLSELLIAVTHHVISSLGSQVPVFYPQNQQQQNHTHEKPKQQQKSNRREERMITHLTRMSPKHTFTTESPVSALTCVCALTLLWSTVVKKWWWFTLQSYTFMQGLSSCFWREESAASAAKG